MSKASACGKVILCGEHAVVYGQPALALPLPNLRAEASLSEVPGPLRLEAPDLNLSLEVRPEDEAAHPLVTTVLSALGHFEQPLPGGTLTVSSQIPIGKGLGSGTAITSAIYRCLAAYAGSPVDAAEEQAFIHQIETLYHGRPSGIDGAVIGAERAIRFERQARPLPLELPTGWSLLIGDSGETTPTHEMVGRLRERHDAAPHRYDLLFTAIGELSRQAEIALKTSSFRTLGRLLNRNHSLLQEMGISTPRLDELVQIALAAGALGAKLSGGGGGGVLIALSEDGGEAILDAWRKAGVSWCERVSF